MRRVSLVTLLLALALPASASAAVNGLLTKAGCIAEGTSNPFGCVAGRGLSNTAYLVISSDGRNLYATARDGNAVAILARNRITGALRQLPGRSGCVSDSGTDGCVTGWGLGRASGLAISPDGRTVYVASADENTVTWFRRKPRSGALVEAGCVVDAGSPAIKRCTPVTGLSGAIAVAVTPDGRNLYAVATGTNTVAAFAIAGGGLRYLSCLADQLSALPGCVSAPGLNSPKAVVVSSDGMQVYVAGQGSNAITTLARSPASGTLTEQGCVSGDNGNGQAQGCTAGVQVIQPQFLVISADGQFLYTSATFGNAVIAFARSSNGAIADLPLPGGCESDFDLGSPDCDAAVGLQSPNGIAITHDLQSLYTASFGDGAVAAFSRIQRTGLLAPLGACFAAGDANCVLTQPLDHAGYATLSPDDRFLYVNAPGDNAITIFGRSFPILSPTVQPRHPRIDSRDRLRLRLACPPRGIEGCMGSVRLVVFALGGLEEVTIAPPSPYDLPAGVRSALTLHVRSAALRGLDLAANFAAWIEVAAKDTRGDSATAWHRVTLSR